MNSLQIDLHNLIIFSDILIEHKNNLCSLTVIC